jgi:signal transduction histidine kinase/CheY-like chemotaxis protein
MLGLALALFAVVALAGRRVSLVLTRDLQRLEAFASRVVGTGFGRERAPAGGSGEVANLARALNQMLDRLNEQHATLEGEREKLQRLTEALRAADRRKDDFLAMLAHELRNPLAPIRTGAEVLRRLPGADAQVQRQSEVIARQARHMTEIVDDLLDVSRVTRGLIALDRHDLDLAEVVQAAVEQVRPLVAVRRHRLEVALPDTPLPLHADRARLVQVVSNLLHNACKYTPEGGHLSVRASTDDGWLSLVVQDNGQGISAELMPELFELFTQGSRTAERAQGGLGLGLALVRQLVELHGGSVQAHSDGPGRGARFTVRLPRRPGAATAAAVTSPVPVQAAALQPRGCRVVVVDDNVDAAESLGALLALEGHRVEILHDAHGALGRAQQPLAQAFVLDIGLPGMDGYELARRLRALPGGDAALLIALTGYGQPGDRERSRAAGFDHHLVKPVDVGALLALLEGLSARPRPTAAAG